MVSSEWIGFRRARRARRTSFEPVDVHRFVEAVIHRLAVSRVVRQLDGAGEVLLAADEDREDRGHEVVGLHALDWRRNVACPGAGGGSRGRGWRSSASGRPTSEHWRRGERLLDGLLRRCRVSRGRTSLRGGSCCWGRSRGASRRRWPRPGARSRTPTQKRLRRARPQARLMRAPKGAWTTSCLPPLSSKKRSKTTSCWVGMTPRAALRGREVARDPPQPRPGVSTSGLRTRATPRRAAMSAVATAARPPRAELRDSSAESSRVRPGPRRARRGR